MTTGMQAPPPGGGPEGTSAAAADGRRRDRRWMLTRVALPAAAVGAVLAGVGAWAATASEGDSASSAPAPIATTTLAARTLVDRETVSGTLGFGDEMAVMNQRQGTVTALAPEGSVRTRGQVVYRVDDAPVRVLYGTIPMYRDLSSGVSDGPDVRELERNLRAMGDDPDGDLTIDDTWDSATTAAVERWQEAIGASQTGRVGRDDVVMLPGPARVARHVVSVGQAARPGQAVLATTSTRRSVTVDLDARRTDLQKVGASARVKLPDGRRVSARVTGIGATAKAAGAGGTPTIAMTVTLARSAGVTGLDQAPVDVEIAGETRRDVLSVPVTALLAVQGGGYGLERVNADGSHTVVRVTPGLYADGYVQVSGASLKPGMTVVTAS